AFGGIGYAASATHSFVSAITSPGNGNGNGNGNAGDRAAPNSDGQASTAQGTTAGGQSTIAPPANPTVQSNANASTQNNGNGNNGNGNNGNDNNGNGNHGNGNNGNGNNGNGNAGNGNNGNGNDDESSADNQYKHKTTICHRTGSSKNPWVIITVSDNALPAHKAHGDTLVGPGGTCPGPPIP